MHTEIFLICSFHFSFCIIRKFFDLCRSGVFRLCGIGCFGVFGFRSGRFFCRIIRSRFFGFSHKRFIFEIAFFRQNGVILEKLVIVVAGFDFDEIEHFIHGILTRKSCGIAVDLNIIDNQCDDFFRTGLCKEMCAGFKISDGIVNVVKDIDIVVIVSGNKGIDRVRGFRFDGVLIQNKEVGVIAVIEVDDLFLIESGDVSIADFLHLSGMVTDEIAVTDRESERVDKLCLNGVEFRNS